MIQLGELLMILELHHQGLSITAIARRIGRDPKTVRKYVERGLEPPAYGPRQVGRGNIQRSSRLRLTRSTPPRFAATNLTLPPGGSIIDV